MLRTLLLTAALLCAASSAQAETAIMDLPLPADCGAHLTYRDADNTIVVMATRPQDDNKVGCPVIRFRDSAGHAIGRAVRHTSSETQYFDADNNYLGVRTYAISTSARSIKLP